MLHWLFCIASVTQLGPLTFTAVDFKIFYSIQSSDCLKSSSILDPQFIGLKNCSNILMKQQFLCVYVYERETSVCMCYTVTVKQKTQRLFDEFSYSFNT